MRLTQDSALAFGLGHALNQDSMKVFFPWKEGIWKDLVFRPFPELSGQESLEVLSWRNHETVRSRMFRKDLIAQDEHLRFVESLRGDRQRFYFRIDFRGNGLGVVDYYGLNTDLQSAFFGQYLNPKWVGSSMGCALEFLAVEGALMGAGLCSLRAETGLGNEPALRLHEWLGFHSVPGEKPAVVESELQRDDWLVLRCERLRLVERLLS
jgi:UDP-4-amino-4,6-dideoxy-N-acetyl-beta-L-altrosamine N-acetyltransferase